MKYKYMETWKKMNKIFQNRFDLYPVLKVTHICCCKFKSNVFLFSPE